MTNDYAALVAMLDQAAADLQAGCEFVSSPSGTGSHMAAHRRRTDGAA